MLARTPEPPYYAVVFTSLRTDGDQGYARMAERMMELAAEQPGFLGVESARGADGLGITVSYWTSGRHRRVAIARRAPRRAGGRAQHVVRGLPPAHRARRTRVRQALRLVPRQPGS